MLVNKWTKGFVILFALLFLCTWALQMDAWARAGGGGSRGRKLHRQPGFPDGAAPTPYTAPRPTQPPRMAPSRPMTPRRPRSPAVFGAASAAACWAAWPAACSSAACSAAFYGGGMGGGGGGGIGLFDILLLAASAI